MRLTRSILAALLERPFVPSHALAAVSVFAPDPIFAAIEAHRVAKAKFAAVALECAELEELLPIERRQSCIAPEPHGMLIVASDDPRWIRNTGNFQHLNDAETDAAIALVSSEKLTRAGALALLRYALELEANDSRCWPDELCDDDGKRRTWHFFLMEQIAGALDA